MRGRWQPVAIDDWAMHEDDSLSIAEEPLGSKEKFWVTGPGGVRYLFKYARAKDERVMGEDWVEWVVHQLGELIGIPTAVAIPATHHGRRGVLSRSVLQPGERLIHGNELFALADPWYETEVSRPNPRYTVTAVQTALASIPAPDRCAPPVRTAFDAWAGYVMLDAWVAGRDRHHENWAVIEHGGARRLAPSFDHGNALGFQEPEPKVADLAVDDARLAAWARRGRSPHFPGKPTLVQVARDALRLAGAAVHDHWIGKLTDVSDGDVGSVLAQVPDEFLSEPGRIFRTRLLTHNRERIVHGD